MPQSHPSPREPLLQMQVQHPPSGLNDAVFSNHVHSARVSIHSSDTVTAVAATGGLLWVGTASGRLIRHDTVSQTNEEVRSRLGTGRLDSTVWRIYADPYSHGALVVLRNADGYHAHGRGLVRPRWLSKLRGLRCVSATWIRVPRKAGRKPDVPVALLGTAFGALFYLSVDEKYEKDDKLAKLWAAPNGERIDGIRVEQVAGKFVATIATTSALYLFCDAPFLNGLFDENRMTVLNRVSATARALDTYEGRPGGEEEELLPTELQFMTGSSGVASRRFVWAGAAGITYAQLVVKRRRNYKRTDAAESASSPRSTVIASIQDMELISWSSLKEASGSAVPLACNLTSFHVLVLYPSSVFAFNQISGQLTQRITVWSPTSGLASPEKKYSDWPLSVPKSLRSPPSSGLSTSKSRDAGKRVPVDWEEGLATGQVLSSPAAGFARDVMTDALWIYTEDGEFSRLVASNEEQTEAWKAAKAMNRFDLAMALAPFVSSATQDNTIMVQTREAVLEAQADLAASEGDWDLAAQLYAKTNRPIESVILSIVEACVAQSEGASNTFQGMRAGGMAQLRSLGIGTRLVMTRHIKTYLVRKLDRTDSSKPMQRTIIATILVQLYATHISSETDEKLREEVKKDFGNFLADRHEDLNTSTAFGILSKNGCHEEAWRLAVLAGDISTASELSSRRGEIDQTLSLLKNRAVSEDLDKLSQIVCGFSSTLIPQAPFKVSSSIARTLKREGHGGDHIAVVQGLARVARGSKNEEVSSEAYRSAVSYLFDLLHDWKSGTGKGDPTVVDGKLSADWYSLITFLFQLHSEFGTEAEAQRSFDHLVVPRLPGDLAEISELTIDALGAILRSSANGGFHRLRVHLYQALSLHVTAIQLAVEIDVKLAEAKMGMLWQADMPVNLKKSLWCLVASKSDDPVGVVERSRGLLHIEDVLTSMEQFESATERIKTAVAESLEEHKRLAVVAKSDATAALEVTTSLREDLEGARAWQNERLQQRYSHLRRSRALTCGHRASAITLNSSGLNECKLCGRQAIMSIDSPFDSDLTLPLEIGKQFHEVSHPATKQANN